MMIGYVIYYMINDLYISSLVAPLIVIIALFVVNRLMTRYFLKSVRIMTKEEIEEIHANFQEELEEKAKEISQKFNLSYGNN